MVESTAKNAAPGSPTCAIPSQSQQGRPGKLLDRSVAKFDGSVIPTGQRLADS